MFSPGIQAALDKLTAFKGQFQELASGIRHTSMADTDGWYACPLCVLCDGKVSNHAVSYMMVTLEMTREEVREFMKAADRSGDYDPVLCRAIYDAVGLAA